MTINIKANHDNCFVGDVNYLFRSFDFRDFLENICIFLFGISGTFPNIVKMLLDNIRLYFILW